MAVKPTVIRDSNTWLAVRAHVEEEIERLRTQLEASGTSADDTAFARGRIAALRGVLTLEKPPVELIGDPDY